MEDENLSALLADACTGFDVPGAQLGVMRGRDRTVVCAGIRELETRAPVTRDTSFHAGSIAKSLVALVVLEAARRGKLDLDRPCADQAPGLWADTPRELMAQVTGRPNVLPDEGEDLESFVARIGSMPRVHQPGRFSYCNAGWLVLDLLLRERVGSSFEELAMGWVLSEGGTFGEPAGSASGHDVATGRAPHQVPADASAVSSAAGARWWSTADHLLDYARLHLGDGAGRFHPADVQELRRPHATVPGATVSDAWGLGWALWDRGGHRAFGWAGYTSGHRAYLRCFPDQDAALVVLTNAAGPLLGPPGGSAVFDAILPDLLEVLGVPPLRPPAHSPGQDVARLAGRFGPLTLTARPPDGLDLDATAFGEQHEIQLARAWGNSFVRTDERPGGMTFAIDGDLLYVGPFALPRTH